MSVMARWRGEIRDLFFIQLFFSDPWIMGVIKKYISFHAISKKLVVMDFIVFP